MTPAPLCTIEHFVIHNKIVFTVYRKTEKSRAFAQLIITIPIPKIMQTFWVLCVWHSVHCALCACVEMFAQANKELSAVSLALSTSLFLSRNSIRSHDAQIQIIFGSLLLLQNLFSFTKSNSTRYKKDTFTVSNKSLKQVCNKQWYDARV